MRLNRLFVALLGVFLAGIASAQNVRTFVATTGLDTNDCLRQTPCRTFNRAIAETNVSGEVVALDSGGYGPALVDKSITILAPDGVHAAIAPTTGNAITLNLEVTESVLLQNLFLNGLGAISGVHQNNTGKVVITDLVVSGFVRGISSQVGASAGLTVRDSIFRGNSYGTHFALFVDGFASVLIEGSLYSDNTRGVLIEAGGTLSVVQAVARDVTSVRNHRGFIAEADSPLSRSHLDLEKCVIVGDRTSGSIGVEASASVIADTAVATVRVSDSVITANQTAISTSNASVLTRLNNTVEGNVSGETFSGTFTAK